MCAVLEIKRSTYYYQINLDATSQRKTEDMALSKEIERIFKESRNNYGTRKIKRELLKLDKPKRASRRLISRIMRALGLVSNYTVAQFKPNKSCSNEALVKNELQREFIQEKELAVVVSDLTYVRVSGKWHYVCLLVDLFNREIIGPSVGESKTASLFYKALASISANLNNIQMFHTDRGKEFDNKLIDDALEIFNIQRSLSMKECPYDNAVAEATFKVFKTEFANQANFSAVDQLEIELNDYVHWFNNIRIHGTLGYLTPTEFKLQPI